MLSPRVNRQHEGGKELPPRICDLYEGAGTTCYDGVIKRDHKWYVPAVLVRKRQDCSAVVGVV